MAPQSGFFLVVQGNDIMEMFQEQPTLQNTVRKISKLQAHTCILNHQRWDGDKTIPEYLRKKVTEIKADMCFLFFFYENIQGNKTHYDLHFRLLTFQKTA